MYVFFCYICTVGWARDLGTAIYILWLGREVVPMPVTANQNGKWCTTDDDGDDDDDDDNSDWRSAPRNHEKRPREEWRSTSQNGHSVVLRKRNNISTAKENEWKWRERERKIQASCTTNKKCMICIAATQYYRVSIFYWRLGAPLSLSLYGYQRTASQIHTHTHTHTYTQSHMCAKITLTVMAIRILIV